MICFKHFHNFLFPIKRVISTVVTMDKQIQMCDIVRTMEIKMKCLGIEFYR